jgi:hypothetical protein
MKATSHSSDRACKFADEAEAIVQKIESGAALTTYMHRSHSSCGHFTAWGDVFPEWVPSDGGGGQWFGSQFGRFEPRLTFHITDTDSRVTVPHSPEIPRYYVDCAGFVRELLSAVFPRQGAFDPKSDLIQRADANDVPAGTRFAARHYPRAHIFFYEFDHCPSVQDCVPGNDEWGLVTEARLLRRGDVVVERYGPQSHHTGHIWVAITDPDASGCYESAESGPSSGVARVRRKCSQITGPNFRIGRLVEATDSLRTSRNYRVRHGTTALIRRGPDIDSEEFGTLPSSSVVTALESNDSQRRIKVETSCGVEGWITKKYLELDDDACHPQEYSDWRCSDARPGVHAGCCVGPDGAILRRRADISNSNLDLDDRNPIVFVLRPGEPLKKKAERLKVEFTDEGGRKEGWISAWYLERC